MMRRQYLILVATVLVPLLVSGRLSASLLKLGGEEVVKSSGSDIKVTGCSVPSYVDWNNDGRKDLIVGEHISYTQGKVRVYLNTGTQFEPSFSGYSYVLSNSRDLTVPAEGCLGCFPRVVYWDDDLRKDLLVGVSTGTVRIYLNVGADEDPVFDSGTTVLVSGGLPLNVSARTTPVFVDWNSDGMEDLVVGALDAKLHVYINSGSSWPVPAFDNCWPAGEAVKEDGHDLYVPSGRPSPQVLDLNGDGKKDLLVGNSEGELLLYANIGTDAAPQFAGYTRVESNGVAINLTGALDGLPRSRPFVCDWTGDGYFDVLVGSCDGKIHLYQSKGQAGDVDRDYDVDFDDLRQLSAMWLQREFDGVCRADLNGDGAVDARDLAVLGKYWQTDPGMVAHWRLDESEGTAARDSAGGHEGLLMNGPQWQPGGGMVGGALALDGIDDYVYVPFVLNPSEGAFSIFMWIKGGGPGQVIMSQIDTSGAGRAWLCCDVAEGKLMTELQSSGRGGAALISDATVSDGNWHRVGLVWDGSHRHLYVDGEEVAADAAPTAVDNLRSAMFIGVGGNLAQNSHFSGLIDDVRIYNQAVAP